MLRSAGVAGVFNPSTYRTRRTYGENSKKEAHDVWVAQIFVGGRKKYVRGTSQHSEREAIERAKRNLRSYMAKLQDGEGVVKPRSATLAHVIDRWLTHYGPEQIKETVKRKYRAELERHILPYLGQEPIEQITNSQLQEHFHSTLVENGTGTSARWNAYKTLNTALNWAMTDDEIQLARNPLRGIAIPRRNEETAQQDELLIGKRTNLTIWLLKKIQDPENPDHDHYPRIITSITTGMRRSELLGLTWENVNNLDKKGKAYIVVRQQLARETGRWFIQPETKNRKHRTIQLPELTRQALLQERAKNRTATRKWASDLVFLRSDGAHIDYNHNRDHWRRIWSDHITDETSEPIRWHYHRHIFASLCFRRGIPMETTSRLLGHGSSEITRRVYTHLSTKEQRDAMEAVSNDLLPPKKQLEP